MAYPTLSERLRSGTEVLGHFWLAEQRESVEGHSAAGVARWTPDGGTYLQLIGPLDGWPKEVSGPFRVVHGVTTEGDELTLLNATVASVSFPTHSRMALRSYTTVVGDHAMPDDRWERVVVRTANLHEWLPETGIDTPSHEFDERGQTTHLAVSWKPPDARSVELEAAELRFAPVMRTEWSYSPDWSIRTSLEVAAVAEQPQTIEQLYVDYAAPLLGLLVFAGDRPDALTREVVRDPAGERRGEILRAGRQVESRDWRPASGYLFSADDLPDFEKGIHDWFELHAAVGPALNKFTDTLLTGNVYTDARLVELATALEAYAAARHSKPGDNALKKLERLRDYAALPANTSWAKPRNLKLIVASRNYLAHLTPPIYGFAVDEIRAEVFETTRRAQALMQLCLLRELGFEPERARELLEKHYSNWPLPEGRVAP